MKEIKIKIVASATRQVALWARHCICSQEGFGGKNETFLFNRDGLKNKNINIFC